jgi:DHA3 family tetracycline resistance protein-like MFS transporter
VTAAALKEPAVTPAGREGRLKILRPLKVRDFALLWTGMTISVVGDGIYMVTIPFLVYQISNLPTALAAVGAAWTIPQVVFLLLAGVVTDRFDRRRVLIGSDLLRAFAIGLAGGLSVVDALELWHLYILVAIFGAGEAFFMPAFGAIVPEVVPKDQLVEANSLDQFVRPIGMRLVGPVIGGLVVAAAGPGEAFLIDAATFVFSAVMVMAMRRRARAEISSKTSVAIELREGLGFIRSKPWLWGGLLATALGQLAFYGPWVVLVPFVIRNSLGGGASNYGWVLAAGGVGAILVSIVIGQRGLPHQPIVFVLSMWALATFSLAGFGVSDTLWQPIAVAVVLLGGITAGQIVWGTLEHRYVPNELLGRVSSVDWLVSTSLLPLSFLVAGPAGEAFGARRTLIVAGMAGAAAMLACLLIPGIGDLPREKEAAPAS